MSIPNRRRVLKKVVSKVIIITRFKLRTIKHHAEKIREKLWSLFSVKGASQGPGCGEIEMLENMFGVSRG